MEAGRRRPDGGPEGSPESSMTADQFEALAGLLRLRKGPAERAAFLVLVEGLSVPDAARAVGLDYKVAHRAVQRARKGLELAKRATL